MPVRVLYVANLIAFMIASAVIGGYAVTGHSDNGRYFVKAVRDGVLTEVTRDVFIYSNAHFAVTIGLTVGLFAFEHWRRQAVKSRPPPMG